MRLDYDGILTSVKAIVDEKVSILDGYGLCLASTNLNEVGKQFELPGNTESVVLSDGDLYLSISDAFDSHILKVEIINDDSEKVVKLVRLMIANQFVKKDKEDYLTRALQGTLTDEELQYVHESKFFGFEQSHYRVVTFDTENIDGSALAFIARQLFENQTIYENGKHLVLISTQDFETLYQSVVMFLSEVNSEIMITIKGAIGKSVTGFSSMNEAYVSSIRAFELGRLLHEDQNVLVYEDLMIPFMLDAVDPEVVGALIAAVEDAVDSVFDDEELVMTMTQFFLNDLNITETARNLFVHRNTLIYRLSKIEKMTGLDLKKFEDAVKLYLILYIKKIS